MMLTIFVLLPIGNSLWRSSQEHCRIMGPSGSAGKSRSVDQTPGLDIRDLLFVRKTGACSASFDFSPYFPKYARKIRCPKAITRQIPFGKQPLKRENRLSAVPTDQARRTVARPHHGPYFKEMHNPGQSPAKILLRTMPGKRASVKLHANL